MFQKQQLTKEQAAFNLLIAMLEKACQKGAFSLYENKAIYDNIDIVGNHLNNQPEPREESEMSPHAPNALPCNNGNGGNMHNTNDSVTTMN